MLAVDSLLQQALASHQSGSTRGIATYQGRNVAVQLDQSGSIQMSASGQVQASTNVTAIGVGGSLVPRGMTDPLATYGQEMRLIRDVDVAGQTWSIPLGVFRITDSDHWFERLDEIRGDVVLDWSVALTLQDRFESIVADDFLHADGPSGGTCWEELQRLSPIAVQRSSLSDQTVPVNTVYDSRYGAISKVATILGGVPALTRTGALTVRLADAWLTETDPVFDINGTIDWSEGMSNDFYNQVTVPPSSDPTIFAYAALLDDSDPRSVGRAGGRTYKLSSAIYDTKQAAQEGADTALARLLSKRSRDVTVQCTPEALLLDLGDFGWMRDPVRKRAVLGEVSGITVPVDATQPVEVQMIAAVTEG